MKATIFTMGDENMHTLCSLVFYKMYLTRPAYSRWTILDILGDHNYDILGPLIITHPPTCQWIFIEVILKAITSVTTGFALQTKGCPSFMCVALVLLSPKLRGARIKLVWRAPWPSSHVCLYGFLCNPIHLYKEVYKCNNKYIYTPYHVSRGLCGHD